MSANAKNLPEPMPMMKRWAPFLLLCVVGVLLYGHTLQVPFYLDDDYAILENPVVTDLPRAFGEVFSRRGLSTLTFALNFRLGGFVVAGYHLVNIAIHLTAACLVLLLLRRVFPQSRRMALFGALVFLAHPLQTQAVTYTVQRMTSLSALFFLLSLYLFDRGRERLASGAAFSDREHLVCYLGSLLAGGLAILAKENAVILPLALLLWARLLRPVPEQRWRPLLICIIPFLALSALTLIACLLVPVVQGKTFNTMGNSVLLRSMEGNTPLNYLATQCSVLWIYVRMLFLPYGQALDHGYPVSRELLTLKSAVGFSGLVGLGFLAWRLRQHWPIISAAIAWFFMCLAVESSIIPLDPLFEHRLYLPMFGFAMLVIALLGKIPKESVRLTIAISLMLVFSVLTWQRNALWQDPVAFFTDNLKVAPDNERVYFNLGQAYINSGLPEEGERLIRQCISMNPARHLGYRALKELYLVQGRDDDAIGMLHYALEHVTPKGFLYNDLAFFYGRKGDFATAVEMLRRAIAEEPNIAEPYFNLAQVLMFAGDRVQVDAALRRALELDPAHAGARAMLNDLLRGKPGS